MRPSQMTIFHYVTKSSNKIRELTTTTKKKRSKKLTKILKKYVQQVTLKIDYYMLNHPYLLFQDSNKANTI